MNVNRPAPLVSLCIPTYNRAWCLKEILQCALQQQTDWPFEVLVVDNASTDDTAEVVRACQDDRLRYERNPENLGIIRNWNRCLELARGDYLSVWGDDDLIGPDFVQEHAAVLQAHPEVGLVYSACAFADMHGQVFEEVWPFSRPHVWTSEQELDYMTRRSYILCSPMMRRALVARVGQLNTEMEGTNDWEFWLRLACQGGVGYLAKIYYTKRYHTRQTGDVVYMGYTPEAVRRVMEDWEAVVANVLRQAAHLAPERIRVWNARRYAEIAKVELAQALAAARRRDLPTCGRHLGAAWKWQMQKAGGRYLGQTALDMLGLLRKRLQGRTKYVFE